MPERLLSWIPAAVAVSQVGRDWWRDRYTFRRENFPNFQKILFRSNASLTFLLRFLIGEDNEIVISCMKSSIYNTSTLSYIFRISDRRTNLSAMWHNELFRARCSYSQQDLAIFFPSFVCWWIAIKVSGCSICMSVESILPVNVGGWWKVPDSSTVSQSLASTLPRPNFPDSFLKEN